MSGIIGQGSKSGIIGLPTIENSVSDYEEGTWTATWVGGVTSILSSSTMNYTKIGRTVHLIGWNEASSASGPSGMWEVSGLPFPRGTGNQFSFGGGLYIGNCNSTDYTPYLYNHTGSSSFFYINIFTGTAGSAGAPLVKAATHIMVDITYETG